MGRQSSRILINGQDAKQVIACDTTGIAYDIDQIWMCDKNKVLSLAWEKLMLLWKKSLLGEGQISTRKYFYGDTFYVVGTNDEGMYVFSSNDLTDWNIEEISKGASFPYEMIIVNNNYYFVYAKELYVKGQSNLERPSTNIYYGDILVSHNLPVVEINNGKINANIPYFGVCETETIKYVFYGRYYTLTTEDMRNWNMHAVKVKEISQENGKTLIELYSEFYFSELGVWIDDYYYSQIAITKFTDEGLIEYDYRLAKTKDFENYESMDGVLPDTASGLISVMTFSENIVEITGEYEKEDGKFGTFYLYTLNFEDYAENPIELLDFTGFEEYLKWEYTEIAESIYDHSDYREYYSCILRDKTYTSDYYHVLFDKKGKVVNVYKIENSEYDAMRNSNAILSEDKILIISTDRKDSEYYTNAYSADLKDLLEE